MAERKTIPKKIRFEVFKRDKFTCQYCGRSAPDVTLQVDHIKPVSKGGKNDIMNLVTSCRDCNAGKSDRELSDDSAIVKQQRQLQELAERNEQLQMMLDWREGMVDVKQRQFDEIKEYFEKRCDHKYRFGNTANKIVRRLLKEFSLIEILDAMDISFDQYYDGSLRSTDEIVSKLPGICANRKRSPIERNRRYWFNYLRKALDSRCYNIQSYNRLGRLRLVCDCMWSDDDFERAKRLLVKYSDVDDWLCYAEEMINERH